jgi:putative oxidoreductase
VNNTPLARSEEAPHDAVKSVHGVTFERWAIFYARVALGAAFLSAVADRFGLWGKYGGWGNFATFTQYTAQVNSFMPAFIIPFLARAATAAELTLGITLIIGIWPRWVAFSAATLLFLFGTAMAISFGPKSPLDYSVFSASAGALLLALHQSGRDRRKA